MRDESGATALHYIHFSAASASWSTFCWKFGAGINVADLFEHSRGDSHGVGDPVSARAEGGADFYAVELSDMAYAIQNGQEEWVQRFLTRYPGLKKAKNKDGVPFRKLAETTGNLEIVNLFE